ncbi:MAG: transcriptional regulator, Crp/Fnr family [Pseudonocardiales bacterium]|nr:transcriptional regulator, Crp/Fnr family [Pseudonocardiales bacterium]
MLANITSGMAQVGLFAGLDADSLSLLAVNAFVRKLARGQVLFTEGEPSDHLYVVRSGRLRVFLTSPRGEELVLSIVGPGEALGELSILDRRPRSASVDALDAVQVVVLPAADVRMLLEQRPEALMAAAVHLAAGMRRLTGSAADLVFLDLPRRLAKLLLGSSVQQADGTTTTVFSMNQSGVAAQLGVTRQSFNRALAGLAQRRWIDIEGTRVHLRDVAALQRFADS